MNAATSFKWYYYSIIVIVCVYAHTRSSVEVCARIYLECSFICLFGLAALRDAPPLLFVAVSIRRFDSVYRHYVWQRPEYSSLFFIDIIHLSGLLRKPPLFV